MSLAKKKILVCACFVRSYGIVRYTSNLINGLVKIQPDIDITLLVFNGNRKQFSEMEGSVRIKTLPVNSFFARLLYFHIVVPFITSKYNLVHCVGNLGLFWTRTPQVLSVMDTYEQVCPDRFGLFKRIFMRIALSLSGRAARTIIAISDNTKTDIARFYPHLKDKTIRIYLGTDLGTSVTKKKSLATDPFLFVGTIEPGKNLVTALRGLNLYRKAGGTRTLEIVGSQGWGEHTVYNEVETLQLGGSVTFIGFLTDKELLAKYCSAFAFIFPSLYEGFGLPVLEAMSNGCPVIAARNSAIPEAGGEAALYFDARSPGELAEKMLLLEADSTLREECINRGKEHSARFNWETTATETLAAYKQLMLN